MRLPAQKRETGCPPGHKWYPRLRVDFGWNHWLFTCVSIFTVPFGAIPEGVPERYRIPFEPSRGCRKGIGYLLDHPGGAEKVSDTFLTIPGVPFGGRLMNQTQ